MMSNSEKLEYYKTKLDRMRVAYPTASPTERDWLKIGAKIIKDRIAELENSLINKSV